MTKPKALHIREGGQHYRSKITIQTSMYGKEARGAVELVVYDGPRVATVHTTAENLRRFILDALGGPP